MRRLVALIALAATLAIPAFASASLRVGPNAEAAVLAGELKGQMQAKLGKQVSGMVFTKVHCNLPSVSALKATCQAHWKIDRAREIGIYYVKVAYKTVKGGAISGFKWSTTGVTCADAKTNKKLSC
ncbi:MAG: hypothetical protein F2663_01150 [Actinobacteria bacterium]|uniref:Unannotated protein n=1 Tax=freshwater metagenome TaxID=449393 RepID=A0A6J6NKA1_9ZZZZ|nr:hypothetical protein [Actinomycetota bacterium]